MYEAWKRSFDDVTLAAWARMAAHKQKATWEATWIAFYERRESVGQGAHCWETAQYQRLLDECKASTTAEAAHLQRHHDGATHQKAVRDTHAHKVACQEAACAAQ